MLDERIFTSGFSVTLYASFSSEAEYYGKKILEPLYKIMQELEILEIFSGLIRVSDYQEHEEVFPRVDSNQYFNEQFFKGKVS